MGCLQDVPWFAPMGGRSWFNVPMQIRQGRNWKLEIEPKSPGSQPHALPIKPPFLPIKFPESLNHHSNILFLQVDFFLIPIQVESTSCLAECFQSVRDSTVQDVLESHVDNKLTPALRDFLKAGRRDGLFIPKQKVQIHFLFFYSAILCNGSKPWTYWRSGNWEICEELILRMGAKND